MRKYKYTEEQVLEWANYYLQGYTLLQIEKMCGVPDATIRWSFEHRLSRIDVQIFSQVDKDLQRNKYIRNRCVKIKDGLI